jgi:hypothetical protein
MKNGHKFLIGMIIMAAGFAPSWEWSPNLRQFTLGMGKSPLIRWVSVADVQNGFRMNERTSWNVELFSASGGLILAGIMMMANAGRRDDKNLGGGPRPPSPPAA